MFVVSRAGVVVSIARAHGRRGRRMLAGVMMSVLVAVVMRVGVCSHVRSVGVTDELRGLNSSSC